MAIPRSPGFGRTTEEICDLIVNREKALGLPPLT
jgi:hypothetical protein